MDCSPLMLLHPWDLPGKSTGVRSYSLLQGIFPTQGSNLRPTSVNEYPRIRPSDLQWQSGHKCRNKYFKIAIKVHCSSTVSTPPPSWSMVSERLPSLLYLSWLWGTMNHRASCWLCAQIKLRSCPTSLQTSVVTEAWHDSSENAEKSIWFLQK